MGEPAPALLDARPSGEIPWDAVGSDWFALDFPLTAFLADSTDLGGRGLYLVAPDDGIYGVSALPSNATDVVAVSAAGRFALLRGPYAGGSPLVILDLATTAYRPFVGAGDELEQVRPTRDGSGLWVYDLPWSNDDQLAGGTLRLSRVDLADLSWSTVFEEPVTGAAWVEYYDWWVNNRGGVAEMPDGRVVVSSPGGVFAVSPDGANVVSLDAPGTRCAVVDVWGASGALVRCGYDDRHSCDDEPSTLWVVPTDESSAMVLAEPEHADCTSYLDAVALDGDLAITAGFGSGECNGHVLITTAGSIEQWEPPIESVRCAEWVVGSRNGAWLIAAANPYVGPEYPIAVFEVTTSGSTVVDVPGGRVIALTP